MTIFIKKKYMKITKIYNSIITESISKDCLHKFGKQLFGSEFGDEKDNDTEIGYKKLIELFTSHDYGPKTPIEFVKAMKDLKKCISSYPEILKPEGDEVYRGTKIPFTYLIKHVKEIGPNDFKYTYKANSIIQSWTTDYEVAEDFSGESAKLLRLVKDFKNNFPQLENDDRLNYLRKLIETEDILSLPIPIILRTNSDDETFLFKSKYFEYLSSGVSEHELLRIGNKPINTNANIRDEFAGDIILLTRELAQFIAHHNKDIDNSK